MLDPNPRHKKMADMLYELIESGEIDNEWEENFICGVRDRLNQGLPLIGNQESKLEELFERH